MRTPGSAPRRLRTSPLHLLWLTAALGSSTAGATTLRVPSEYPTIQAAVQAAATFDDTVLVAPGSYPETVTVSGKCLSLIGEGHSAATSVTGLAWTSDDQTYGGYWSMIQRMTIMTAANVSGLRNNFALIASDFPAHVQVDGDWRNSSVGIRVTGCAFRAGAVLGMSDMTTCFVQVSTCSFQNGELRADAPEVDVLNSTFDNAAINVFWCERAAIGANQLTGAASDLNVQSSSLQQNVEHNVLTDAGSVSLDQGQVSGRFANNTLIRSGGVSCVQGAPWTITNNRMEHCSGGIHVEDTSSDTNPDHVAGNVLWRCGSGLSLGGALSAGGNTIVGCTSAGIQVTSGFQGPVLENNLVTGNLKGIVITHYAAPGAVLQCNDSWDNAGGNWIGITDPSGTNGNFSANPIYCNEPAGDLELAADSPCLPGHHPYGYNCGTIGAEGEGCSTSTGVAETPPVSSTWGLVKQRFVSPGR